jgi:spore coat protein U-like protein
MRYAYPICALAVVLSASTQAALNIGSCSVTNTSLSFGLYNPLSPTALTNNASSVQITCQTSGNGSAPVTAQLSRGAGSFQNRTLRNPNGSLRYNVFVDPAWTIIWGDGTGGTSTQSAILTRASGTANWITYGLIPAAQTSTPAGTYTDLLQVTIAW